MTEKELKLVLQEGEGYKFEFDSFFTATFYRPVGIKPKVFAETFGVNFGDRFGVKGARLERVLRILELLYQGGLFKDTQFAEEFRVTSRTIENDIMFLREHRIIEFIGAPKTGRYVLTKVGKKLVGELK